MKTFRRVLVAGTIAAIVGLTLTDSASAQPARTFMRKNVFYLPIRIDDRVRPTLKEVRLYYKEEGSRPWQLRESVPPGQSFFSFRAEHDGEYWFAVVTVDLQGQTSPADVQREGPGLIVVLDTVPPRLQVQPLEKTEGGQMVRCTIQDDNAAPEKLKFHYQTGNQMWHALEPVPQDPQTFCIPAQAVLTGMIRVTAADRAENSVMHEINLSSIPAAAEPAFGATPVGRSNPAMSPPVIEGGELGTIVPQPPPAAPQVPVAIPAPAPPPFAYPTQPPTFSSRDEPVIGAPPLHVQKPISTGPVHATPPVPNVQQPFDNGPNTNPSPSIFDPQPPHTTSPPPAPPLFAPQTKTQPIVVPPEADTFPLQQISRKPAHDLDVPPLPLPATGVQGEGEPGPQPRQPMHDPHVRPTTNVQPSTSTASQNSSDVPNKQLVNRRQMFLQYQIEQTGASGVGRVEVWLTRDRGQTWEKYSEDADRKSPAEITLPGEGLFGITLVVSNGRGFGATPPQAGDPADLWVEVDVTRPHAELLNVRPDADENTGSMVITWTARDRNLPANSINLTCSAGPDGPWQVIARGLENQGQYRWNVPVEVGPHAYIRLEVADAAGNVTESRTAQPIALDDLSRPRARIRAVSTTGSTTTTDH